MSTILFKTTKKSCTNCSDGLLFKFIEKTRLDPKQRIADFATGFADRGNSEVARILLLCDRFCFQVSSLYCDKMANNLSSEENSNLLKKIDIKSYREVEKSNGEGLKDWKIHIFHNENKANELLEDKDSMSTFLSNIKNNLKDRKLMCWTVSIVEGLFSEKCISALLNRGRTNVSYILRASFENEIVDQEINKDLKSKAVDFIGRLFSEKHIKSTLKCKDLISTISNILKESLESKFQVEKVANIVEDLFSKKSVNGIFKNKFFLEKILSLLNPLFINVSDNNKDLKEKVIKIVEELFSKENINSMFKKDFDKRVNGSAWEHINLMSTLADILPGMLKSKCLREKANEIIGKLFSGKNINIISMDEHLPINFIGRLFRMLKDKQLDKGSKDAAYGILKDLFSEENIGTLLKNGEHKNCDSFGSSLGYFLKSFLEGVSDDKELEGKVLSLIEKFMENKNVDDSFKKKIKKEIKSAFSQKEKYTKSDGNIENTVKAEEGNKLIKPVIIW